MPALGDFFRINASRAFVEPWDIWLQTGLLEVRGALGENWQDCFMSAPIWRFTLAAGVAGPDAMLGVLMPSVDRVGREFPLTLMIPLQADVPVSVPVSVIETHFAAQDVFCRLENLVLNALDDDMTRDRLEQLMTDTPQPVAQTADDRPQSPLEHLHHQTPDMPATVALPTGDPRHPTVWTAILDRGPMMMVCDALPDATHMRGLFDLTAPVWHPIPQPSEVNA